MDKHVEEVVRAMEQMELAAAGSTASPFVGDGSYPVLSPPLPFLASLGAPLSCHAVPSLRLSCCAVPCRSRGEEERW